jgi:molecular chaperone DnaJ
MNYFVVLGLDATASKADIKKSYRKLAMKYHPDRESGNEERFKSIKAAYEYLSIDFNLELHRREHAAKVKPYQHNVGQPQEKKEQPKAEPQKKYSTVKHSWFDVQHILKDTTSFFKTDEIFEIWMSANEAEAGCRKTMPISKIICKTCNGSGRSKPPSRDGWVDHGRTVSCTKCNGSGKTDKEHLVNVPSGAKEGSIIICHDHGSTRLKVRILKQEFIKIDGSNIYYYLDVSYAAALLGGMAEIVTPNGVEVLLRVPPKTENGRYLRLQGFWIRPTERQQALENGDIFYVLRIK